MLVGLRATHAKTAYALLAERRPERCESLCDGREARIDGVRVAEMTILPGFNPIAESPGNATQDANHVS